MSIPAAPRLRATAATAIAEAIIEVAQDLSVHGLAIGTTGNVSGRVTGGMLITPSRSAYATLRPHDLVFVDDDGTHNPETGEPSTETPLHAAIYRARPDAGAIVHCHSPHATAWSHLGEPLIPTTEDSAYYAIGPVHTAPAAAAGTEPLAHAAAQTIGESRAVLLAGHGVLTLGATPADALIAAQVTEHQAQIAWLLRSVHR